MYPVLIRFGEGGPTIYTYGFFIALGFLAGMAVGRKESERIGIDPGKFMDLAFYILIAAIISSRIFYIFTTPKTFLEDPLEIFRIWNGGLVFYGGFIGAAIAGIVYLRMHKLPVWQTADVIAPAVAIGHMFGRIGCFFAGCCYGRVCDLPWAVTFTHEHTLAPDGIPLHPTQLYSAISNFLIFCLVWSFRKKKAYNGQVFWVYVFIYGIARSFIEFFRGDPRGGDLLGFLSISQTIGITMSLTAVVMMAILMRRTELAVNSDQ